VREVGAEKAGPACMAGRSQSDMLRMPKPPSRIERLACSHWSSVSSEWVVVVVVQIPERNSTSKGSEQGEHRKRGALKEDRNMIRAT
jgi:hypothetical protein